MDVRTPKLASLLACNSYFENTFIKSIEKFIGIFHFATVAIADYHTNLK